MLRVGLVGCGNIGRRRAACVAGDAEAQLVAVSDADPARAAALAAAHGAEVVADWPALVERDDIDAVVVAAPNDVHAPLGLAALAAGKHVLIEKPLARTPAEAEELVQAAERAGRTLQTGFNHRWYPTIQRARQLVDQDAIGRPIMARCRYGHGGRDGWEREWFAQQPVAGGGTFLDNGVHALDLFRWFLGDFAEATGMVATLAWPVEPSEDNGVGLFRTADGRLALLHSSWTQWDPVFSFELFGERGLLRITGRETLVFAERGHTIGPVSTQSWHTPTDPQVPFEADWREFHAAIREGRPPLADGRAGLEAIRMAYAVYEASQTGRAVRLDRA